MIDRELIADCVHCGFCLPTCPTYGPLWQEEMDSPRGRIHLMDGLLEGTVPLSATDWVVATVAVLWPVAVLEASKRDSLTGAQRIEDRR